jgi:hypothetical protein
MYDTTVKKCPVVLGYKTHTTPIAGLPMYREPDRICGLVIRVPGYRSRFTGFNSQRCQISGEVVQLSEIEELLERSSGSGLENQGYGRRGAAALTT